MIVLIFIFGLIIGSFLNSVIYRLRHKRDIVRERSVCPNCQKQLKWYELMPLISFIIQSGKCRKCHKKISWQYPLVELATGVLFAVAYLQAQNFCFETGWPLFHCLIVSLLKDFFIISILIIIFVFDLKWQIIPDKITLPAIGIVVVFNIINWFLVNNSYDILNYLFINLLIAAGVGGGFFLLQYLVSRGRWIGGGDIRLGVLMGVILGWPQVLWALMLSYIIGAIFAIILILIKLKTLKSQIPFGTFLSAATIVIMYWAEELVNWYLSLF